MLKRIKQWFMQYTMKAKLIEALRQDVKTALAMVDINQQTINVQQSVIEVLTEEIKKLREEIAAGEWWQEMDEEEARMEAEERSDEVEKLIQRDETMEALRVNKTVEVTVENKPTDWISDNFDDSGECIPVHLRDQAE